MPLRRVVMETMNPTDLYFGCLHTWERSAQRREIHSFSVSVKCADTSWIIQQYIYCVYTDNVKVCVHCNRYFNQSSFPRRGYSRPTEPHDWNLMSLRDQVKTHIGMHTVHCWTHTVFNVLSKALGDYQKGKKQLVFLNKGLSSYFCPPHFYSFSSVNRVFQLPNHQKLRVARQVPDKTKKKKKRII